MLGSYPLVAFVATCNAERAKAFYRNALGLRMVSEDWAAAIFDANGTTLRVSKVQELTPAKFTVLGWNVPDIVATVDGLVRAGVKMERFGGMLEQDGRGIWTVPGGSTRVAWFKDPDGNTLSVSQP